MWCLLRLCALSGIMSQQCVLLQTQITNFSFQELVRRKSSFFSIFWTPPPFFSWVNGNTSFWARPPKIAQAFLLAIGLPFWMRSWRNAWQHQLGSRKGVLNAEKKFVIELYVIRSWWKIKFKNKREIHQLVFSPLHQY